MVWDWGESGLGNGTDDDAFWQIPPEEPPPPAPNAFADYMPVNETQQPGWGANFYEPSTPEPGSLDFLRSSVQEGRIDQQTALLDWYTTNQIPLGLEPALPPGNEGTAGNAFRMAEHRDYPGGPLIQTPMGSFDVDPNNPRSLVDEFGNRKPNDDYGRNMFEGYIPGVTPVLRDVQNVAGDVGEFVGRNVLSYTPQGAAFNELGNALPIIPDNEQLGKVIGEGLVPTNVYDIGLTALGGAQGYLAGREAGEGVLRSLARAGAEAFATDPTEPIPRLGSWVPSATAPSLGVGRVPDGDIRALETLHENPVRANPMLGEKAVSNYVNRLERLDAKYGGNGGFDEVRRLIDKGDYHGAVGEAEAILTDIHTRMAERAGMVRSEFPPDKWTEAQPQRGLEYKGGAEAEQRQMTRQALHTMPVAGAGLTPEDLARMEGERVQGLLNSLRGTDDEWGRKAIIDELEGLGFDQTGKPLGIRLPDGSLVKPGGIDEVMGADVPFPTKYDQADLDAMKSLDEGSVGIWKEIRQDITGDQWNLWNAWKETLAPEERVARGREWTDLLDLVHAAPDQETRVALDNLGLDKLRTEIGKAELVRVAEEVKAGNVIDITARLKQIEQQMDDMYAKQAALTQQMWGMQTGGYRSGSPGARHSREAADFWMGGGRNPLPDGRRGPSGVPGEPMRIPALRGAAETDEVKENLITILADVANMPRALMAGADISPILTHMAPLLVSHPELTARLVDAGKVMLDEAAYKALLESYNQGSKHAAYGIKLNLPSVSGATREGSLTPSRFVGEKLPIYRETNRFINASVAGVRSAEVDRFISKLEGMDTRGLFHPAYAENGRLNEKGIQAANKYARAVESVSGRGNLGAFQGLDRYLSGLFFSPSYTLSQVQRFAPLLDTPFTPVWNETARNLGLYIGAGVGILTAAAAAGATVQWESGPNFGKITTPDGHHINIFGGFQPLASTIYSMYTGESLTESGGVYPVDRGSLAASYGVNRLSPQAGLVLQAVPQEWRNKLGDKELQGALWPQGRPNVLGDLARDVPPLVMGKGILQGDLKGQAGRLALVGKDIAPLLGALFLQDAYAALKKGDIKDAIIAGGLSALGAGDRFKPPTTFTQQTRAYDDIKQEVQFPDSFANLARGDKFIDLSSREKELVRQTNPDLFDKLINEGEKNAREKGDQFQKALDTQKEVRDIYRPVFDQLLDRLNAGQLDPYTARKAAEMARDQMQKDLNGVQFPENTSDRQRSQIQNLLSQYNAIYDKTVGPDGKPNFDLREQLQQAMIADVTQRMGQEWGARLQFNTESRINPNDPVMLQIEKAAKPITDAYYAIPQGPADNPKRNDARNAWLMDNPHENAQLYYLGRVSELRTPQAVQDLQQLAPGVRPVVDFYLGFEQKGNVDRATRDRAANVYFNLPGEVNRQDWRRENPQADAILWRSGYVPNVVSLDAYRLIGSPAIGR